MTDCHGADLDPETTEDSPWGHISPFKVKGKASLFLASDESWLKLSMNLPRSRESVLDYPFTEPNGYGLGRAGWVSSGSAAMTTCHWTC